MDQERLFRLAYDGIDVGVIWEHRRGWRLRVRARRADEAWSDVSAAVYEGLTHEEMLSTLESHLRHLLDC